MEPEIIKTFDGVAYRTDPYDRGGTTRVREGYIFRCKVCGRYFFNRKEWEHHKCNAVKSTSHSHAQNVELGGS